MTSAVLSRVWALLEPYRTPAGRQALRNLIGLNAWTLATNGCAAVTLYLLTWHLSPAHFGAFIFALTIQNYLFTLSTVGSTPVTMRDANQRPEARDAIFASHLLFNVTCAGACAAGAAIVAWAGPWSAEEQWVIALLALGNIAASINVQALYDLHHRQALCGAVATGSEVLAVAVLAVMTGADALTVERAGLLFAGKWTLTSAAQLLVYHRAIRPLRGYPSVGQLRALLRSALPASVSWALAILPYSAVVAAVRLWHGDTEAGVCGLAWQVSSVYLGLGYLAMRVVLPHVTGPYGLDRRFIGRLAFFVVVLLGTLGVASFAVAAGVIVYLLEPSYLRSLPFLALFFVDAALLNVIYLLWAYLIRLHRGRRLFLIQTTLAIAFMATVAGIGDWSALTIVVVSLVTLGVEAVLLAISLRW